MRMKKFLMVVMAFLTVTTAYAAVWRVNPRGDAGAQFKTVYDALTNGDFQTEDTILLDPGYHGDVYINRNCTLIGTGYNVQDKGWSEGMISSVGSINVESNCKVEGVSAESIRFQGNNSTVSRCKTRFIGCNGVSSAYNNCIVEQCLVTSTNSGYNTSSYNTVELPTYSTLRNSIVIGGVYAQNGCNIENNVLIRDDSNQNVEGVITKAECSIIRNNIIINPVVASSVMRYYLDPKYNNTIVGNIFSIPAAEANADYPNNFYIGATLEDIFVNKGSEDARYMLREDSPAKGYATHGGDCGAFDGPTPYVLNGIPRYLPHITEAKIPSRPTDGKISVKLKIETQNE